MSERALPPGSSRARTPLVRAARAGDLDGLLALYAELAEDPRESTRADEPAARTALEAIIADPSHHLAVASSEARLIATADLLIAHNLTHHAKPWGIVENVVVSCAHRRAGVGTALLGHLVRLAEAAGCYKVQLLSGSHRTGAHAFYRALGFEPVAEGFKLYLEE